MLKMLIVEDERWEREGLQDFLDWQAYGVEVCGLACDGIDGIEQARRLLPDIIITDIKMPGMDGIKMSGKIREFIPGVKIIILTGYDDFKLAKDAINISANAYILKPVDEAEIRDVIKRVADECNNELVKLDEEKKLKSLLDENILRTRKNILLDLLRGRAVSDAGGLVAAWGIDPSGGSLAVLAVKIDSGYLGRSEDYLVLNQNLGDIEAFINDIKEYAPMAAVADETAEAVLVCLGYSGMTDGELSGKAALVGNAVCEKLRLNAAVGVGKIVESADQLCISCQQARDAANFAVFCRDAVVFTYSELECVQRDTVGNIGDFLMKGSYFSKQLLHSVRSCDDERAFSLLDEMFEMIYANKWAGREAVANYLYGLVNEASLLLYNLRLHPDFTGEDESVSGRPLLAMSGLQTMKNYIYEFFERVFARLEGRKNNKDEGIVKKLEQLVSEKYASDISLKTIAAEIYLSPNYLGSIFKRVTGRNFNEYLCQYRMDKAKELLQSPKNKVSRVAREVGIPNTSYFCMLFKNFFGIAPGEYQEMIIRKI